MSLQNSLRLISIILLCAVALFTVGCQPEQPVVYEIPKEESPASTVAQPQQPVAANNAKMQILPGMQASADAAPELSYGLPEGWEALEASGIRLGNFRVSSTDGVAEVTILTFPGDVGGNLANINRWRSQVGLGPTTAESLPDFTEAYAIAGHRGLYVRLQGDAQSILAAILPFHGNTWFFKMLGDTPVVLDSEAAMRQFLDSVQFVDHAH